MHGVVSLLDNKHDRAVKELWAEIERDFGVSRVASIVPYPHFSYQIANEYDERNLVASLEAFALHAEPFQVKLGGLSVFTGPHLVLHLPVVRTQALSQFHQRVWDAITPYGREVSPLYASEAWIPHVTLAEHDIESEKLGDIVSQLSTRELYWEIPIDNLAIIWDTGAGWELRYRFNLQGTGAR